MKSQCVKICRDYYIQFSTMESCQDPNAEWTSAEWTSVIGPLLTRSGQDWDLALG
jgi:hypothetical protein